MNRRNIIIAAVFAVAVLIGFGVVRSKPVVTQPVEEQDTKASELYQQALTLSKNGDWLKSKEAFKALIMDHADFDQIPQAQKELEAVNTHIIFSNVSSPHSVVHEVKSGDTLGELAKKYGTTIRLIKLKNKLDSDVIRIGQRLTIWNAPFNVFIDKSQNVLLLKQDDEVIKVYNVSTGEDNSTPVGEFKITSKLVDPVWFNRGAVVPPESPQNVLGSRWLGFDIPGYGIHGTIEPDTIGTQVTAGCIRMRNSDVEQLYDILPIGTKVVVVD